LSSRIDIRATEGQQIPAASDRFSAVKLPVDPHHGPVVVDWPVTTPDGSVVVVVL